jgi:hypothetical protein
MKKVLERGKKRKKNNNLMAKYYLSKSDFKVAMTCPAKLYYRKLKFPTTMEGNEFMEMLAEGDYMVG